MDMKFAEVAAMSTQDGNTCNFHFDVNGAHGLCTKARVGPGDAVEGVCW